jgi:hypothetical protein
MSVNGYADRMSERVLVHHRAMLIHDNRPEVEFLLLDLSAGGFKGRCSDLIPVGESYELDLGVAGVHRVQICWRLGDRFGGEFLNPLSWGKLFRVLVSIHTGEAVSLEVTSSSASQAYPQEPLTSSAVATLGRG